MAKSNFKLGCSPITHTIFAGNVNKNGLWAVGKKDVTDSAVGAVAEDLLKTDTYLRFDLNGKTYDLKVVEVSDPKELEWEKSE